MTRGPEHHTPETKEKIRQAHIGMHPDPDTKEKIRRALMGRHHTPERIEKNRLAQLGKHHTCCSAETRAKISRANRGKHPTPETIQKMREGHRRNPMTPEHKEKIRQANRTPEARERKRQARLGWQHRPETKEKMRQARLGKHLSPETREKLRVTATQSFSDPEYLKKWQEGIHSKTRPEARYEIIVDSIYPNMIKYNGQGQQGVSIDGMIPDFVVDGKKQVIEVFGKHWHPDPNEEKEKQERYTKHDYSSLIIWDYELKNEKAVVQKTVEFVGKEPHLYFEAEEGFR